ncbi:MAG TPA: hypothetical protein DCY91_20965 [Cyanobacteria bacterium UBA11370]|nr:hypothetical protein [Cyanobacteria bacterium UBA11370]
MNGKNAQNTKVNESSNSVMASDYKVLVGDDDVNNARRICSILQLNGYGTTTFCSKFYSLKELEGYDAVILDIVWRKNARPAHEKDDYFGLQGARYLKHNHPKSKIILMSKFAFDLDRLNEINNIADDFFSSKSADSVKILNTLSQALNKSDSVDDNSRERIVKNFELAESILDEVDERNGRKPDLLGLSSDIHAVLLQEVRVLKSILLSGTGESTLTDISNHLKILIESLNMCSGTITKSFSNFLTGTLNSVQEIDLKIHSCDVLYIVGKSMSDNRSIDTGGGNYIESNSGTYIQGDYISMNSDLVQAASQIQDLIEQLQKRGLTTDVAQEGIAKDIATQSQNNPTIKEKLLKWGQSLGDATVSDVVKGTVKLAIRSAGLPLP